MHIDLFPEVTPSSGYQNTVTAMVMSSRYLFAYPTSSQDAGTVTRVVINIMTKHAYSQIRIISKKGSVFVSQVIKDVADVQGITLEQATTKLAQKIGKLERMHASVGKALKMERGGRGSMWHKYVNLSVLNYNTSYYTSIGCEYSWVFYGRDLYNVLI